MKTRHGVKQSADKKAAHVNFADAQFKLAKNAVMPAVAYKLADGKLVGIA